MKKGVLLALCLFLIVISVQTAGAESFSLDLESGAATTGYNNVRIPGEGGTRFSLKDDVPASDTAFLRLKINWNFSRRHGLSVLVAPLSFSGGGVLGKDVIFRDRTFSAGEKVNGYYRFNSYRLTYRYLLVKKQALTLRVGLTVKIRDAEIRLDAGDGKSDKKDLGFVPLLHADLDWKWSPRLSLAVDIDALAARQGRAEDVGIFVHYRISDSISLKVGYRLVEGGADNEEVYTFAAIHYLAGGVVFRF